MRRPEYGQLGFLLAAMASLSLALLPVGGCGIGSERKDPLEIKLQKVEAEKTELRRNLEQCRAENQQLAQQIKALSAVPKDKRIIPYRLDHINIVKYSNFYDKNDDGIREKFVVYIQPVDTEGDSLKAAGTINVQLWNLNNLNGQALLGQWTVEPNDLKTMWFDTLTSASYRLVFDTPKGLDILAEPLTIKATFTDYLTGEIFRDQEAIDPNLMP